MAALGCISSVRERIGLTVSLWVDCLCTISLTRSLMSSHVCLRGVRGGCHYDGERLASFLTVLSLHLFQHIMSTCFWTGFQLGFTNGRRTTYYKLDIGSNFHVMSPWKFSMSRLPNYFHCLRLHLRHYDFTQTTTSNEHSHRDGRKRAASAST